jgi:beta-aspartyl-dipeptidase (metallo-type)
LTWILASRSRHEREPLTEMFTIIENGEIYAPEPLGVARLLLAGTKILKVGEIDASAVERLGLGVEVIDAAGCLVTPGLIDPHQHLLGGSGESGFASQTPAVSLNELVCAGITTVVGCLGSDTTTKTPHGLLAKVKGLDEESINAFMWTGGYSFPPACIAGSAKNDIMFIKEVIGTGEIAIADHRSSEPTVGELARLASDTYVAGTLAKKAGLVHLHIGEEETRLQLLRDVLENKVVKPEWFYPTHIQRSEELVREAIDLAKQGCFVDIDTVDKDLVEKLALYRRLGGPMEQLTISSDASITSPQNVFGQVRECVVKADYRPEEILPLATKNTARALKLTEKGEIAAGNIADILVIEKTGFELRDVFSRGRKLLQNGRPVSVEKFLEESDRKIVLEGKAQAAT